MWGGCFGTPFTGPALCACWVCLVSWECESNMFKQCQTPASPLSCQLTKSIIWETGRWDFLQKNRKWFFFCREWQYSELDWVQRHPWKLHVVHLRSQGEESVSPLADRKPCRRAACCPWATSCWASRGMRAGPSFSGPLSCSRSQCGNREKQKQTTKNKQTTKSLKEQKTSRKADLTTHRRAFT